MQIHELDNFSGTIGNAFTILDDGQDTGKVSTAELLNDVNEGINEANTRIDNLISAVTVNSEVIDARVGADGITYASLGKAIRSQVGYLTDDIMPLLINSAKEEAVAYASVSGYYGKNGTFYTYAGVTAATVNVSPGEIYFLTSRDYYNSARVYFADSNNDFISAIDTGAAEAAQVMTPVRVPPNAVTMVIQRINNYSPTILYSADMTEFIDKLSDVADITTEPENISIQFIQFPTIAIA